MCLTAPTTNALFYLLTHTHTRLAKARVAISDIAIIDHGRPSLPAILVLVSEAVG